MLLWLLVVTEYWESFLTFKRCKQFILSHKKLIINELLHTYLGNYHQEIPTLYYTCLINIYFVLINVYIVKTIEN